MKLFVWDFHGVLEKDNEKAVYIITNKVLEEMGYKERLSEKQNDEYLGLKWYQYFEMLMPDLSTEKCLELQAECFRYVNEHRQIITDSIKANDHVIELLRSINDSNNQQIIISNTRPDDLIWYLNTIGIKSFFNKSRIIGVNAHQTHKSKSDALRSYLSNKEFSNIVAIGDSEGDLALGKEFDAITYYYRHPGRKHEETKNADYIINDLREILKEI